MNPLPNKILRRMALVMVATSILALPLTAQDASGPNPPPVTSWSPTEALERMQELGIVRTPGEVPVHVSAGYEARGAELGELLAAAVRFYEGALGVRPPVELAVLGEADWARTTPIPYGFPHPFMGRPNVVFLGAAFSNNAAVEDLRSRAGYASAEDHEKVRTAGLTWDEASGRLLDLVGFHELGHVYTRALGIRTHQRWFSEMLATYIGYAFVRSERPELALVWEGVLASLPASPRPDHTSLADFERLYLEVGIPNYQWYQGAFQVRVAEVYDAQGTDFVHRVREALPADTDERLSTDDLLARLERIQPGFHAWADRLGLHTNP
jgi:hypothetical protein